MTKKRKIQLLVNEMEALRSENSALKAYDTMELGRQMSVIIQRYQDITDKLERKNRKLDKLIWLKLKLGYRYMFYLFKTKLKKRFSF